MKGTLELWAAACETHIPTSGVEQYWGMLDWLVCSVCLFVSLFWGMIRHKFFFIFVCNKRGVNEVYHLIFVLDQTKISKCHLLCADTEA